MLGNVPASIGKPRGRRHTRDYFALTARRFWRNVLLTRLISRKTLNLCLAVLMSGLLASSVNAAKMKIDRVDTSEWEGQGKIIFYVDILNESDEVEEGLKSESLKIFIDDEEIPGKFDVQTYADAKKSVSLGIVIMSHNQFIPQEPQFICNDPSLSEEECPNPEDHKKIAIKKEPFEYQKRGYANLVRELGNSDRVAVWTSSNADEKISVKKWTSDYKRTADLVQKLKPSFDNTDAMKVAEEPNFLRALKKVIKDFGKDDDAAERKVLMVVSDGSDKVYSASKDKAEKKFEDVATKAKEAGIKFYTIGYTKDDRSKLGTFETLAQITGGVSREISKPDPIKNPAGGDDLPGSMNNADMVAIKDTIESLGNEIKLQYVITFTPEDYGGAEEKVAIRLEAEAPESKSQVEATVGDSDENKVELKEKAFDWVMLIVWILVGILSILLLFFFIRWLVRRANRPKDEIEYEEDDGPTGPYKGKLSVQGGPMVGAEFYLTEDVTTIGRMDGNDIVLQGAGISQRHAGIKIEDMRFELADFGSTNGTLVNGNKITKQFLRDNDKIVIGDCEIRFSLK